MILNILYSNNNTLMKIAWRLAIIQQEIGQVLNIFFLLLLLSVYLIKYLYKFFNLYFEVFFRK